MTEPTLNKKKNIGIDFFKKYIYIFVVAFVLIFGVSYSLTFFLQNYKIIDGKIRLNSLTVNSTLDKSISLSNLAPTANSNGITLNSKTISISNSSSSNGIVSLYLDRTSGLALSDLKYGLFINGVLINIDDVPSDGLLYESAILGNETINVEVRLWVNENYAGAETTFVGELSYDLSLDTMLASTYIDAIVSMDDSLTLTNNKYSYASNSTTNYVYFNCTNRSDTSTCEKWRIVGVEDGRLVLATTANFGNTFTNSNIYNTNNNLNDTDMIVSMSTDGNAVYLAKTVKIVGSDGTNNNPYILENNLNSFVDNKVIATITYDNNGVTSTQPIYYGVTNYISQYINDSSFQGWTDGVNTYQLGDTISFTANTTLEPAEGTIDSCPGCKFIYTTNVLVTTWNTYGETPTVLNPADLSESYLDVVEESGKNYFLGVVTNGSNQITKAYACGIYNGTTPFCIEGDANGTNYSTNSSFLNGLSLWNNTCDEDVRTEYALTECGPWDNSSVSARAYSDGEVNAGVVSFDDSCIVRLLGDAFCNESSGVGPK